MGLLHRALWTKPNSLLEKSPSVGDSYGTGIEIWAGFGPLKKGVWADYEQLSRVVFSCFQGQKNYYLLFFLIVASALKVA